MQHNALLPTALMHWATRHNIPADVFDDLVSILTIPTASFAIPPDPNSEQYVQTMLRLDASQRAHTYLWRNNLGAMQAPDGRVIRYGLCNDSKAINAKFKSSDLIGGTPVLVKPKHVGMRFLVFTAIEVKKTDWVAGEDKKRETAQLSYINAIRAAGGIGFFCNNPLQYQELLNNHGVPHATKRNRPGANTRT